MFDAVFNRNMFKIHPISNSAHMAYNFWHHALGQLELPFQNKALTLYSDADILAKLMDFIYSPCVERKTTRGS
jgi:hypothetical protein